MEEDRIEFYRQMDSVSERAHALAEDATDAQKERLVDHIRLNVASRYYADAEHTAFMSGCDIVRQMRVLIAEAV